MLPTISAANHRKDQERRRKALRDLNAALQDYCETVPRERDVELTEVARIFCSYACELYDSRAAGYLELPTIDPTVLFGDAGVLNIGPTLEDVWHTVQRLKVRRPKKWPEPEIYRDDDTPAVRCAVGEILIDKYVHFSYLIDDPWFCGEVRDRVARRAHDTREMYERRFVTSRRKVTDASVSHNSRSPSGSSVGLVAPNRSKTKEDERPQERAKPGPKVNLELARRVRDIVRGLGGDGRWQDKFDEVCDALDEACIPRPKTWSKPDVAILSWLDAATTPRGRELARKAITHHLDLSRF